MFRIQEVIYFVSLCQVLLLKHKQIGLVETEMYVLFECTLYEEERERWRGAVGYLKDGMDEYELGL